MGHDHRIMARNDVVRTLRERNQLIECEQMIANVVNPCERTPRKHILIEMGSIGRQHKPAAPSPDSNSLRAIRMAAEVMKRYARSNLFITMMKTNLPAKNSAHHLHDVILLVRMTNRRMTHARTRGKRQFALLNMNTRLREQIQASRVIEVKMRNEDLLHVVPRKPEASKSFVRPPLNRAAPLLRYRVLKPDIDHIGSPLTPYDPNEVIQRHGAIMGITTKENRAAGRLRVMRVLDCIDLVWSQVIHVASESYDSEGDEFILASCELSTY